MTWKYLFLLFAIFVSGHSIAQRLTPCRLVSVAPISIDFFGTNDGLSQGMINGMCVDSDGYLWLATNAGLNRFDGRTFKVYTHRWADTTSIASNHILGIYVDGKNRLWLNIEGKGVDCFDRRTEVFTHYNAANGLSSNIVNGPPKSDNLGQVIILHSDGKPADILIPTHHNGINEKDGFDLKKLTEVYPGIAKAIGNKKLDDCYFTATGDVWYYCGDSICHLNAQALKSTGQHEAFSSPGFTTEVTGIFEIFLDAAKRNVYLPDSNGLNIYSEREKKFIPCMKLAAGYKFWGRPMMDHDGRLWCTQANGNLLRINNQFNEMEVIEITAAPGVKNLLRAAKFWLQDKYGNIWMGTSGWGTLKINNRRELFKHTDENGLDYNQLPFEQFRVVKPGLKAIFDASLREKWLNACNKSTLKNDGILLDFRLQNIYYDSTGCFWLYGQKPNGIVNLIKLNPANSTYIIMNTHKGDAEHWFYIPLIIDKRNNFWYSERSLTDSVRLYRFNPVTAREDSFAFPLKYEQLSYGFITDWVEYGDNLWLATCAGLFSFNTITSTWQSFPATTGGDPTLASGRLLSICADPVMPDRYLWIGSAGAGLCKLDKTTGTFITYNTKQGLPDNTVYAIQTDARNNLWLGTGNGLCLFNPLTLQCGNFSVSDGLPGTDFNSGQYSKAINGELHFGCVGGHVYFNPEDFYKPTPQAQIAITQLKLLNKPVDYTPGSADVGIYRLTAPIEQTRELIFNYDQRMISFDFSLLDLTNPARNKYKYMLQGLDQDWIDNGYNNEAVFTNLNPGKYTLKIMGQNSGGTWTVNQAALSIIILPPWWAKWWFRSLVILIIAGSLYLAYRYRLQQLLRMERMRNQIAQDLHDEIGSTLSSISLYSAVMLNSTEPRSEGTRSILNKIIESASQMMESMNDMVWAIKADNDSFENVINRMRSFAVNVTEAKGIQLHFSADRRTEKLELNMAQRKNIYLIFKEAVNNAVKYSRCKNLHVNIADTHGTLHLTVKDDGTGFDFDSTITSTELLGGNGLQGMQARAKEINGNLQVQSTLQKGTFINFAMPV